MPVALSYHKLALYPLITGLKNAHAFISKAVAHIESEGHDAADYTSARLYPDMFDFTQQVYRFTDGAKGIPPRVNPDNAVLTLPDVEKTFPELLERITRTIEYLEGIDEKSFEGREGAEVILGFAKGTVQVKFNALEYVQVYAQPNFWFHITTAYDLLRMKGVPLGKMDILNGAGGIKVEMVEKKQE